MKYTKKQICEAIAYWKKQLKLGNYRTVNESGGTPYTLTLKAGKDQRKLDSYTWMLYPNEQSNSDGIADALKQFAKNEPKFKPYYEKYLDGDDDTYLEDVGILETSWESPNGDFTIEITPDLIPSWED